MSILYTAFIRLFGLGILLASPFKEKARKWVKGRRSWKSATHQRLQGKSDLIWFHCSSLGEYEQGRPVIEELASNGEKILLSFFSPSGFENLKKPDSIEFVFYLPLDTPRNAIDWLDLIRPKAVFFVKYEFWYNYIRECRKRQIPLFLVSGIFRESHYFFKSYGAWFRKQLSSFTQLFVQDEFSFDLLNKAGLNQVSISGDTRFDRVSRIATSVRHIEGIQDFIGSKLLLIAGSTWPKDEELLAPLINDFPDLKIVLAPHEVKDENIRRLKSIFGEKSCTYSEGLNGANEKSVLIIDRIGLLSSLYSFGQMAYVGGGFDKGIHNTLEAAVFGLPISFGPNYDKFREAHDMIAMGGAKPVTNYSELKDVITQCQIERVRKERGELNSAYVKSKTGATSKIIAYLKESSIVRGS